MAIGGTSELRGVGRRLRWALYNLTAPKQLRVPTPPWRVGSGEPAGQVVARFDADDRDVCAPEVYGKASRPSLLDELPASTGPLPLALRQIDDVVLAGAEFIVDRKRGEVLAQSFGGLGRPRDGMQGNGLTQRPPPPGVPAVRSDAPVFLADLHYDEFGHRLLELAPRLLLARQTPANTRIVTSLRLGKDLMAMSGALELAAERWQRFERPMFCRSVFVPDPPLRLRRPVHPLAFEAFARIARLGQGVGTDLPERLYLSRRRIERRPLRNEAEIEAIFAGHGFAIVHPQEHPFELQVAMAANARLIAGPAGSAMHLAVLAPPTTRVLILSSPRSFDLTEPYLNPAAGRLGLVFGTLAPDADGKLWAPWQIDAADVRAGIAGHFGLDRASPPSA